MRHARVLRLLRAAGLPSARHGTVCSADGALVATVTSGGVDIALGGA